MIDETNFRVLLANSMTLKEGGKKVYYVSKSRLVSLINWVHVAGTYAPFVFYGFLTILCGQLLHKMFILEFDVREFITSEVYTIEMLVN